MDGDPLSPREREVFDLVGDGLTQREIGLELGISRSTVSIHVMHIAQKITSPVANGGPMRRVLMRARMKQVSKLPILTEE